MRPGPIADARDLADSGRCRQARVRGALRSGRRERSLTIICQHGLTTWDPPTTALRRRAPALCVFERLRVTDTRINAVLLGLAQGPFVDLYVSKGGLRLGVGGATMPRLAAHVVVLDIEGESHRTCQRDVAELEHDDLACADRGHPGRVPDTRCSGGVPINIAELDFCRDLHGRTDPNVHERQQKPTISDVWLDIRADQWDEHGALRLLKFLAGLGDGHPGVAGENRRRERQQHGSESCGVDIAVEVQEERYGHRKKAR